MSARRVEAERTLLGEILLRLRAGGFPVIPVATPNGLHIPARDDGERQIKARLIARMKADGMLIPGASDLVLLWPGGGGFVELKRPAHRDLFGYHAAGAASEDQKAFAARCARLGICHAYCRSWEGLIDRLGEWGALP
ncbi:MAG TPA: hypothetical protein VGR91_19800 [Stellaceae bacterium]|nr:hypothetical protein [Stellaceae bacterium]